MINNYMRKFIICLLAFSVFSTSVNVSALNEEVSSIIIEDENQNGGEEPKETPEVVPLETLVPTVNVDEEITQNNDESNGDETSSNDKTDEDVEKKEEEVVTLPLTTLEPSVKVEEKEAEEAIKEEPQQEQADGSGADLLSDEVELAQIISDLENELKSNIPDGQSWQSHIQNYESMQPDNVITLIGAPITSTMATGKNIIEMTADSVMVFENSPYLSSGIVEIKFTSDFEATGSYLQHGLGIVFKANADDKTYHSIRLDALKSFGSDETGDIVDWVLEGNNGGSYQNIKSTEFEPILPNETYKLTMAFHGSRLVLALNDQILYNGDSDLLNSGNYADVLGQIGLRKRFGETTVAIDEISIRGIGVDELLPPVVEEEFTFYDYEDGNEGDWYLGTNPHDSVANIITDPTNPDNNVLNLKGTTDGRYYDASSIELSGQGSLSFDFQVINAANGYAIGYFYDGTNYNELGFAPHSKTWIFETYPVWSGEQDIEIPVDGQWNNIIINFNGNEIEVFLNGKSNGKMNYDFASEAGHFGFRLRSNNGGAELNVDNLLYSNQFKYPDPIIEYKNDFSESVSGVWTNTTTSVIKDGTENRLVINGLTPENNISILEDSNINIENGTLCVDVKNIDSRTGLALNGNEIYFIDNKWVIKTSNGVVHDLLDGEGNVNSDGLVANKWNKLQANFNGNTIEFHVNGKTVSLTHPDIIYNNTGFGVISNNNLILDNIHYTSERLDNNTAITFEKVIFEDYFETGSDTSVWSDTVSLNNGLLEFTLDSKSEISNSSMPSLRYGVYQVAFNYENGLGVKLGNLSFYYENNAFVVNDGKNTTILKEIAEPNINELTSFKIIVLSDRVEFYNNEQLLNTYDVNNYEPTENFKIINTSNTNVDMKVDAIGFEELRVMEEDFVEYEANMVKVVGTNDASGTINNEQLDVNIGPVVTAVDKNTLNVINSNVKFEVTPRVDHSGTGGRYGFVLRGNEGNDNVVVETDINGKWRLSNSGITTDFAVAYPLLENETYLIDLKLVDNMLSFAITYNGETTNIGTVKLSTQELESGYFGYKSWYYSKTLTIDNLEIEELPTINPIVLPIKTTSIKKDDLIVNLSTSSPNITSIVYNDNELLNNDIGTGIIVNGTHYVAQTSSEIIEENKIEYTLVIDQLDVVIKAHYEILANNVIDFKVTSIEENGETLVNTIALDGSIISVNSLMNPKANYAWTNSNGTWHGISEDIVSDIETIDISTHIPSTMAFVSDGVVALSIENNVMDGGNKVLLDVNHNTFTNTVNISNGTFTYRHLENPKDVVEDLPHMEIVVTNNLNHDLNSDGSDLVDWQDGAIAHREYIYNEAFEADDMQNSMMYIPFNFASNANDPFLNTLDTVKILHNYTDGFGQMLLHKGYQDEGHDSGIPSYSNVGIRQGGVEDLKVLIEEGDQYNAKIGVHLNATEYHGDATDLMYSNLSGATTMGPINIVNPSIQGSGHDTLYPGWDWVDTTFYVDQTKDVLTGELERRFTDLYEQTLITDESGNPVLGKDGTELSLDFYYIDVYTGNSYNAYKLLEFANDLGVKIGTEFAGPLEPGSNFVHWGTDFGYPNKGNGSLVSRFVKNDLDIFTGNALLKGQKLAVISSWGDSKNDIEQGVYTFYNEVLPTKFMQHYGIMNMSTDTIIFEDNVMSSRNHETGMIELTKDGALIATWVDTGTTTDESERHTGETDLLIPWVWDIATNEVLGIDEGAKLYHFNTTGNPTEWTLTNEFKDVEVLVMYELTQNGKVEVETINVVDGKVTINNAKENTGYVLYPEYVELIEDATNWGEGQEVLDFGFNSLSIGEPTSAWRIGEETNAQILLTEGRNEYITEKEVNANRWEAYLSIDKLGGYVYQDIIVEENTGYNIGVWANTITGNNVTLEVHLDGEVYSKTHNGTDGVNVQTFKYRGKNTQLLEVDFIVPEGVTNARVILKSDTSAEFDDVKVFEHITDEYSLTEEASNNYVLYEDFENVSQGYGSFRYLTSGSLKMSLKTNYNFNTGEDFNEIVSAADKTLGPISTWVLDGHTSLKINETDPNMGIYVASSDLVLEPNTKYIVGFEYTAQENANYKLQVISRSTNSILFEKALENYGSNGLGDGNVVSYEFETDDKDDYRIRFIKTTGGEGKTETHAFILDNFYVSLNEPHEVVVENGDGDGEYDLNELVTVIADAPKENYEFSHWYVEGVELEDIYSPEITFKMPNNDVYLKPRYKYIDPTPTPTPTIEPTVEPTVVPTTAPTVAPTTVPTVAPTTVPTVVPTPSSTPEVEETEEPVVTSVPTITPDTNEDVEIEDEQETPEAGASSDNSFIYIIGFVTLAIIGGILLIIYRRRKSYEN